MALTAPEEVDGRKLRREQNREAVLDALVELFGDGIYHPSAAQVAARAGLSLRSLFRYFDDAEDLRRAAIHRHLDRMQPLLALDVDSSGPLTARVSGIVAARVRLYEAIAPTARAARAHAASHESVARQLTEVRRQLRSQVGQLFGPELAGGRADRLPAADVLCSFETYDLLTRDQNLSRPQVVDALTNALLALLAP